MIRGITFASQRTFSADFAHFQNVLLGASGITKGCEIEEASGEITVSEGYFFVSGREVAIVGSESITVPEYDNRSLFCTVVFEIDLSKINTITEFNQGYFKTLTNNSAYATPTQQDLDAGGTIYQMPFATYKLTSEGIENFKDTRSILNPTDVYSRLIERSDAVYNQIVAETEATYEQMVEEQTEAYEKLLRMTGRLINGQQITDTETGEVYTIGICNGIMYYTDSNQNTFDFPLTEETSNTTRFNDDGSIETEYVDGRSNKTVFNPDGSISTTSSYNGQVGKIKTTVFNEDGSITTTYEEGGNE